MTTEEKRAHMLRVVEPTVRRVNPERAEHYLDLIRTGTPAYIEEQYDRFFAATHTSHE